MLLPCSLLDVPLLVRTKIASIALVQDDRNWQQRGGYNGYRLSSEGRISKRSYVDNGYYLFNRRYPRTGIAISISM
jgi:hypothetical protein